MLALLLAAAATVTAIEGKLLVSGTPGSVGQAVAEGATLETAAESHAELKLATGTVVRLAPETRVTLAEAASDGGRFHARLLLGSLWARVTKILGGQHFEVETENAVAGVRGTELRVDVDRGGHAEVRVFEGVVDVNGGAWRYSVEHGKALRFARGEKPAPPAAFDRAQDAKHPSTRWNKDRDERRENRRERRKR